LVITFLSYEVKPITNAKMMPISLIKNQQRKFQKKITIITITGEKSIPPTYSGILFKIQTLPGYAYPYPGI